MQNGLPKHISEVKNGLACGCICPECGGTLVAKHGESNAFHFAHHGKDACANTGETTVHKAAKNIIKSFGFMVLPPHHEMVGIAKKYVFDSVLLEKSFGGYIPDVLAEIGGKMFVIEIAVTHRVDAEKLQKIAASGVAGAIEIHLSKCQDITPESLYKTVIEGINGKKWLYSVEANARNKVEAAQQHDQTQHERCWQEKIKPANDKCWILDINAKDFAIFIAHRGEYVYRLKSQEFDGFASLEAAFKHLFKNHLQRLRP